MCSHPLLSPRTGSTLSSKRWERDAFLPAGDLNGEKKWKFTPCPRETLAGAKIRLISRRKTVWFVCERRFGGEWTSEGTRQRDAGDGGTMKRKRREERRGEKWFVRAEKTETFSKKVLPLFRGNGCCGSLFTLSRVDSKYLYEARTFTPLCSSYVIERNAVSPPTGCLFFFFLFPSPFPLHSCIAVPFIAPFCYFIYFHGTWLESEWSALFLSRISIYGSRLFDRKRIGNINRNVYSNKKKKKKEIITRFILLGPWRFSKLLLFSVVEFRLWKR